MLTFFTTISAALDTLRRHALLFLFLLAAAALILIGRDWLSQHDARAKLEATLAAQQKIVTDADQRQSARDAQLTQTLAQITALKNSVHTPQQAAAALEKAIPQLVATGPNGRPLPSPIEIDLPSSDATNSSNSSNSSTTANSANSSTSNSSNLKSSSASSTASASDALTNLKSQLATLQSSTGATQSSQQGTAAPATQQGSTPPPAILRIPQDDLKPLFDTVEDCQSCRAQLNSAQGDLLDERAKFAAATAQRDAALKAAHGTFWTRVRHNAKWFIIGAAAGAVLARYH